MVVAVSADQPGEGPQLNTKKKQYTSTLRRVKRLQVNPAGRNSGMAQVMKTSINCIVVTLLFGCSTLQTELPERPDTVPEIAEWHGGLDGGAWFVISKAPVENHFYLEAYNDHNGLISAEGIYKLNPECSHSKVYTVDDIRKSISAWTGETVLLTILGGNDRLCSLSPIKE